MLAMAFVSPSMAQSKKFSFGPYLQSGIPVGQFSNAYHLGYGAGITAEYNLVSNFSLVGNAGYMHFDGKKYNMPWLSPASTKFAAMEGIMATLGVRYELPVFPIYAKIEAGAVKDVGAWSDYYGTQFMYVPSIGVRRGRLDASVRYEMVPNGAGDYVAIRVAYMF